MQAVEQITSPDWLTAPTTSAVLKAVSNAGGDIKIVGGAVRDLILGRPVGDLDMATTLPPDAVMAALEKAAIKAVATGLSHGTVTAIVAGRPYEITTLRADIETDGRHAKVAFTNDWLTDASRRDFTINALYLDADGWLFDPFDGRHDAAAGRIRFIGDAGHRLGEDILRLLRFYRFHAGYGRGAADAAGRAACRAAAAGLSRVSGERLQAELVKLLSAAGAAAVAADMATDEIWPYLDLGGVDTDRLGHLINLERLENSDPIRRLAALCQEPAAAAARLRLSNQQRRRLMAIGDAPPIDPGSTPKALRAALYTLGRQTVIDRLMITQATSPGTTADYQSARQFAAQWAIPELPISGADITALGVAEGAMIGQLLRAVETWWRDHDFQPDHAACHRHLEGLLAANKVR